MHESCIHICRNVRKVPICDAGAFSQQALSVRELLAAPESHANDRIRVTGALGYGKGQWTRIECEKGMCCGEQLHAYPLLSVPGSDAGIELSGSFRLSNAVAEPISCRFVAGYMLESFAALEAPGRHPFSFENWDPKQRAEPGASDLLSANCCNIDVRGQELLAEGTLELARGPYALHRLLNPTLCELARGSPQTSR